MLSRRQLVLATAALVAASALRSSWTLVEHALLPTDVVWEEWQGKYELPRALFITE
jgi:hypothetical protein